MSKTIEASPPITTKRAGAPSHEEIRAELHALLLSPSFLGSKRCQQFLEFVCAEYLGGRLENLKERSLAIEVFGRSPQSDLSENTIVRVGAREVRKRLAQHYVSEAGESSLVRIALPPGSYVPEFRYHVAPPVKEPAVEVIALVPERAQSNQNKRLIWVGFAVLALALVAAWMMASRNPNLVAFDRFWEPAFRAHDPLLIAVAHPLVYHPSRRMSLGSSANMPCESHPNCWMALISSPF